MNILERIDELMSQGIDEETAYSIVNFENGGDNE